MVLVTSPPKTECGCLHGGVFENGRTRNPLSPYAVYKIWTRLSTQTRKQKSMRMRIQPLMLIDSLDFRYRKRNPAATLMHCDAPSEKNVSSAVKVNHRLRQGRNQWFSETPNQLRLRLESSLRFSYAHSFAVAGMENALKPNHLAAGPRKPREAQKSGSTSRSRSERKLRVMSWASFKRDWFLKQCAAEKDSCPCPIFMVHVEIASHRQHAA